MSLRQMALLHKVAMKELEDIGIQYPDRLTILSGNRVSLKVESKARAEDLIERYQNSGLHAHYWLSEGNHGWPDEHFVTVGLI